MPNLYGNSVSVDDYMDCRDLYRIAIMNDIKLSAKKFNFDGDGVVFFKNEESIGWVFSDDREEIDQALLVNNVSKIKELV